MKPILFNTEMVKAILEGRKTSTRRIVKPQPETVYVHGEQQDLINPNEIVFKIMEKGGKDAFTLPPYQIRDILYVRETWNFLPCTGCDATGCCNEVPIKFKGQSGCFSYKINSNVDTEKWKPSIHMPKVAARIFLKVTDIKVQRLQDITEDEAKAEGAIPAIWYQPYGTKDEGEQKYIGDIIDQHINYVTGFAHIWDRTVNKKENSWEGNPYVWIIEFQRVEKEE